jgi:hypothetical protein
MFIIRVDDIQSRNTTMIPRSIIDFENVVMQRGGKVSWGVIPHRLIESQNVNGLLKTELRGTINRGNEIFLHGYNHICPFCGSSGHEMFCTAQNRTIPYQQQRDSLLVGLKILSDSLNVVPTAFVPPGHAQDTVTFQVLIDLGYEFLSSSGINKNFIYKNLFNLKQNNEYAWQLTTSGYQQNLKNALQDIRTAGKSNGYYCMLFHDPFIRPGYASGIVLQWTAELLDSLNLEYGSKIKYKTLTEASTAFKSELITVISVDTDKPINFELFQNYPNPFNPSTIIKFVIPESVKKEKISSNVVLKIYDVLGNTITTLVDEPKSPGIYEFDFNAKKYRLSSGIYFYQLRFENYNETKKLILMK